MLPSQEQEKRVPAMKGPLDEVLAIGIFDLQATATALDQSRRRARAAGLQPPQASVWSAHVV